MQEVAESNMKLRRHMVSRLFMKISCATSHRKENMIMSMNGIDISNHQKGLDISKVPCDFVIMKATEGTTFVDKYCDGFYQQAKSLEKN